MTRTASLSGRLREVLLDGDWIANTNVKAQIENLTWQQAVQRINALNSVAELTYHINYYLAGVAQVFEGGNLEIRDQFSFDLPPIESKKAWENLIHDFITNAEKFILHVENMEDEQLDKTFVEEKYGSYLRNIEGLIEHSYYHLGQLSLINKMRKILSSGTSLK